ncbi:MAG: hypothetical protein QOJ89_510 [bacterium]|jgi:hypothetical protein
MVTPSTSTAYPSGLRAASSGHLLRIAADGGPRVGYGHVGRCLALCEAMLGAAAFTVPGPAVGEFLRTRGMPVTDVDEAPIVLLDGAEPTSAVTVRGLQDRGRRVVLLDDLGDGRTVADLVIDPPTAALWPPAGGRRLAGFEHVLLRREVRAADRSDPAGEVLLALGGSDPTGLTPPLAAALVAAGVQLAVNFGPGYGARRDVPGRLLDDPGAFPSALVAARLLVASYGHTLLEAAYLGVPAIIVVTRPDQLEHATAFARAGTAAIVDMSGGARPDELAVTVRELLADDARLRTLAARGPELVDGRGAERVAAAIRSLVE